VAPGPVYGVHPPQSHAIITENAILYPSLNDFMGMEITSEMLSANQVALFPAQSVIISSQKTYIKKKNLNFDLIPIR
jgi:hypothetical protein